ncbi:MAG: hypothetical protein LBS76_03545 [Mycoplasmataceae bacterium]|jgi:hypothetical protein|nr:hypothetical protein [Mycoplasmataceae bacterium]
MNKAKQKNRTKWSVGQRCLQSHPKIKYDGRRHPSGIDIGGVHIINLISLSNYSCGFTIEKYALHIVVDDEREETWITPKRLIRSICEVVIRTKYKDWTPKQKRKWDVIWGHLLKMKCVI